MTRREKILYFLIWAGGSATRRQKALDQIRFIFPHLGLGVPAEDEIEELELELKSFRTELAAKAYGVLAGSRRSRVRAGQPVFESPKIALSDGPIEDSLEGLDVPVDD